MKESEGIKGKVKKVYNQGYGFATEHPYKTAATLVAIAAVASLTAAYFLSPAYATFVGTVGTKAATFVSPVITAMSAFAVAHPLVASLVVLAAVSALIAAPIYVSLTSLKASQIAKAVKFLNVEDSKPETSLDGVRQALELQAQRDAS